MAIRQQGLDIPRRAGRLVLARSPGPIRPAPRCAGATAARRSAHSSA